MQPHGVDRVGDAERTGTDHPHPVVTGEIDRRRVAGPDDQQSADAVRRALFDRRRRRTPVGDDHRQVDRFGDLGQRSMDVLPVGLRGGGTFAGDRAVALARAGGRGDREQRSAVPAGEDVGDHSSTIRGRRADHGDRPRVEQPVDRGRHRADDRARRRPRSSVRSVRSRTRPRSHRCRTGGRLRTRRCGTRATSPCCRPRSGRRND